MKRLMALPLFLLLACNSNSPTEPDPADSRLAWCEDNADRCAWYTEVSVKWANSPSVVPGARGLLISNATQESHQFLTGAGGVSGEIRWSQYVPRSTYWLTIDRGESGGVTWTQWDRKDVQPLCTGHPEIERGVICRVTAEVVANGIGGAGR